jgi:hypothetical protein
MTASDLPEPPPGCPILVEQRGGEIILTYPPRPAWSFRAEWIISGVLLAIAALYGLLGCVTAVAAQDLEALLIGAIYSPWFLLTGLMLFVFTWNRAATTMTFTIAQEQLFIVQRSLFQTKHWHWSAREIDSIGALRGLRIVSGPTNTWLLTDRPAADVAWLADVLCAALQRYDSLPAQPGEIAVDYRRTGEAEPTAGYLHAEVGTLRLRRGFQPNPEFLFFQAQELGPAEVGRHWMTQGIPVSGDNIQCRVDEAGGACLKIDKPSLQLEVLVWCGDKDALHAAVARFWGSRED